MKTILRFIFSIYASFVFMFWIFIAYIVYLFTSLFFGKKKDKEFLIFLYRFIGKTITTMSLLRVVPQVHLNIDHTESYVVVSNHQTMMDIPANVAGAPDNILFKFLGKQEADRLPFFGFLINRLDRKSVV